MSDQPGRPAPPRLLQRIIRTGIPLLVGAIAGGLSALGLHVPDIVRDELASTIGFLAGLAWYTTWAWLEQRWPRLGLFLGAAPPGKHTKQ